MPRKIGKTLLALGLLIGVLFASTITSTPAQTSCDSDTLPEVVSYVALAAYRAICDTQISCDNDAWSDAVSNVMLVSRHLTYDSIDARKEALLAIIDTHLTPLVKANSMVRQLASGAYYEVVPFAGDREWITHEIAFITTNNNHNFPMTYNYSMPSSLHGWTGVWQGTLRFESSFTLQWSSDEWFHVAWYSGWIFFDRIW